MKQKKNRCKVRRLFVLGAGASFSASSAVGALPEKQTPLDKDFCKRICELEVVKPGWVGPTRDYLLKEWRDHVPFEEVGLEQAIIRQIGHLEFIGAIHRRRRNKEVDDFQYLNKLSHIVCYALRRGREAKVGYYKQFAEKAFGTLSAPEVEDRVVTFNYDELLDQHLLSSYSVKQIYFDKLKERQDEGRRRAEQFENPLLVKLHGSVNWRCSTDEFENIVRSVANGTQGYWIDSIWFSRVGTPSPDDSVSPLIIPPLPVKPITKIELFRFLWTKAYEYLHEAEELVICGYSLPETDRLAQSLFANFGNQTLRQVTIVDPNPGIMSKWRALLRRSNVSRKARWSYYEDFGEYVEAMDA